MEWSSEDQEGLVAEDDVPDEAVGGIQEAIAGLTEIGDRLGELGYESAEPRMRVFLDHAIGSVAGAVNALYATGNVKCNLAQPPADLDTRPRGPDHRMITKCFHNPAHCWDGTGNYVDPCP